MPVQRSVARQTVRASPLWLPLVLRLTFAAPPLLLVTSLAQAVDYRSVAVDAAVLYDAPSTKARKLYILGRDYPVEVLVALEGWTKVRDAGGDLAWIEAKQLSERRMLMVRVPRADVRQGPSESAEIAFQVEQDGLLELIELDGNYARVRHADGPTGYVRVTQVWGL